MGEDREERVAIVDLGSNSFRIVVFGSRGDSWHRVEEASSAVRIGEGLAASGRLSEPAIERALATLEQFTTLCERHGLAQDSIDAVATSAIRDADNGAEVLARVKADTGLEVRILSREQEARYAYLAAVNSTTLTSGCVLDLGGGSLQLVRVAGRLARESGSWRMGAVRMTERFLADPGPAKRGQLKALQAHVARKLERASWLRQCEPQMVGVGGTVRNLAAAVGRRAAQADARSTSSASPDTVQGLLIGRDALEGLIERLAALPAGERGSVPGIKQARADIVLAGAVVIQSVMRYGEIDQLEVTEAGLREGIFFERQLVRRRLTPTSVRAGARAA